MDLPDADGHRHSRLNHIVLQLEGIRAFSSHQRDHRKQSQRLEHATLQQMQSLQIGPFGMRVTLRKDGPKFGENLFLDVGIHR